MNHDDLISRLEALGGPCRETDALIYIITDTDNRKVVWRDNKLLGVQKNPPYGAYLLGTIAPNKVWTGVSGVTPTPAYTTSLDAATELCGKMLPDATANGIFGFKNQWEAIVLHLHDRYAALHTYPAIALLIAMFKALEAKE